MTDILDDGGSLGMPDESDLPFGDGQDEAKDQTHRGEVAFDGPSPDGPHPDGPGTKSPFSEL